MKDRCYLRIWFLAYLQLALVLADSTQAFQKPAGQRLPSDQVTQLQEQSHGIDRIWSDPGPVEKLDSGRKSGRPQATLYFCQGT
jgi:hypothetical protein